MKIEEILKNQGGVVEEGGRKVAVFVDGDGVMTKLSPKCTHLGCQVKWNGQESTWDCPCHGSRYKATGEVLKGPAVKDLAKVT